MEIKRAQPSFVKSNEGKINVSSSSVEEATALKKRKFVAHENFDSDVEILEVDDSSSQRQVQIIKVERGKRKNPDVEILKVVPGTSATVHDDNARGNNQMNSCRMKVDGFVGRMEKSKDVQNHIHAGKKHS